MVKAIKNSLGIIFLIVFSFFKLDPIDAQPYNNNWINYSQQYFKFKITKTGIFRINANTLMNAGISLNNIDPRNIQLFGRGKEIPIHVEGENDGVFDNQDYIEFYAQPNDGWFEADFYGGENDQPNPYYSLINDTATYFLTWNNSTLNERFTLLTDTNYSNYTPTEYFLKENYTFFNSTYYTGKSITIGGQSENLFGYDPTEGWFDAVMSLGQSRTRYIRTPFKFDNGNSAEFKTVILSASNYGPIVLDHHLNVEIGNQAFDTIFEGYKKIDVNLNVPINELDNDSTQVTYTSINDLGSTVDRSTVSYLKIKYPHTTDLEGKDYLDNIYIDDSQIQTNTYLRISNFSGTGNASIYDLTNKRKAAITVNGGELHSLLPNTGNQKECVVAFESAIDTILAVEPVNGTGLFSDYEALNADTAFIIITHSSLMTQANSYANYRLNSIANPQNAVVVDVDELYDQFAYGIEKHPYAIRGFADFVIDKWSTLPNYFFLLGKSIKVNDIRKNANFFDKNLVPSFGQPASDNLMFANLNGTTYEPPVPIGRLSASSENHVNWYLNKVMDYENPTPSINSAPNGENLWSKTALHFAGGQSSSDATLFMNYLNGYKNTFEDTLYGGNVFSFAKSTSAPIQTTISDSILNFIGEGIGMMTFFGHASATGGFDQNIDDPSTWPEQNGRYPFLLGNACLAGDIHLASANSVSEQYVLIEDKGVIGFLASVDFGLTSYLNIYSSEFYRNLSYDHYGESFGRLVKATIEHAQASPANSYSKETVLGMTLHGDPSVSLPTFPKPDYMINNNSVFFEPSVVSSELDSFSVNISVKNLGIAINSQIAIELVRTFPNSTFGDTIYLKTINAPFYNDTVSFTLPVDVLRGFGNNVFSIYVDALSQVEEIHETNNQVVVTLDIKSGELVPIYPYNYAIVPCDTITLKASTAFAFEPISDYTFEIDTTDYFNSPIKETFNINHAGGVLEWTPTIVQNMPDSTVYFWRVSKDSIDSQQGYNWKLRSFQYIKDKTGWGQDHFFQFENNNYQFIDHNRANRSFDYVPNIKQLKGITYGAAEFSELWNVKYVLDADQLGYGGSGFNSSLHVAVLDSLSFDYWSSNELDMGQNNAAGSNEKSSFFIFRQNSPTQMNALADMLLDSVPDNNHILVWTWYYKNFSSFAPLSNNVRSAFQSLGAVNLPAIQDSFPFVFYIQKGNPSSMIEMIGDSINHDNLTLTTTLTSSANYANIYSEILGPATSWDSLSWEVNSLENPSKDSTVLSVIGVGQNGTETLLVNSLPTDSTDVLITDDVDASSYPFLKLHAYLADDSLFTAPQLDRWQVTYADVPEAALDPNIYFQFYNDTVQEGENINLSIAIKNISKVDMDSLLISYAILDQYNNIHPLPYPRQKPLLADSVIISTIDFSTIGYLGLNKLLIDVNPNNDQLEKYHFNNVAEIEFFVEKDKINPILDVTFDGIHILDGDIVSPQAEIVVELTDENQFLILDDTTNFSIYLSEPGKAERRIHFNESGTQQLTFIPASLPKNKAKIIYPGDFKSDGVYQLRVQANDKSNNNSGVYDYVVKFEVINKSTITNILNYPNPFSTSTRFVFTLTGSQIPEVFKIQIMTISGKVVREVHKDEFGPIKIGRNISEFAWDGTDKFGDRLANGLYLYKVVTKLNSTDIELRETEADSYFKKGFGKMYLFR